ncbi:putative GTP-binding protein EngB [Tepiditoga spiralis]|uniref:Probable GTP-binding protein EngB n=1 Tax=Tepiditoga spiralis TaxID=2108365 RepID=A0A7G1G8A8_9BACT|nr:ribosome biogenesis GTP-binding protein YihA/YsxC [Tepiditoga spiralis]BBE31636.1 putative GTP-binding protein EngB [Tepiditoga spiralis]
MLVKSAELVKMVHNIDHLPEPMNGEIAFAGRSNVGKSSLLNRLMTKKEARVSSKPGKTRSINYYLINKKYYYVDLPGYGFASVSKTEKEKWENLMEGYFTGREELQMVFVLIDHRHPPQKMDHMMVSWLKDLRVPFTIVLTKMDKLKKNERMKMFNTIKSELSYYGNYTYFQTSSEKGEGINELNKYISMIIGN